MLDTGDHTYTTTSKGACLTRCLTQSAPELALGMDCNGQRQSCPGGALYPVSTHSLIPRPISTMFFYIQFPMVGPCLAPYSLDSAPKPSLMLVLNATLCFYFAGCAVLLFCCHWCLLSIVGTCYGDVIYLLL